jgi:hypothetical protein
VYSSRVSHHYKILGSSRERIFLYRDVSLQGYYRSIRKEFYFVIIVSGVIVHEISAPNETILIPTHDLVVEYLEQINRVMDLSPSYPPFIFLQLEEKIVFTLIFLFAK